MEVIFGNDTVKDGGLSLGHFDHVQLAGTRLIAQSGKLIVHLATYGVKPSPGKDTDHEPSWYLERGASEIFAGERYQHVHFIEE